MIRESFLKDKKSLMRQVVSAWLVLTLGVVAFVVLSLVGSLFLSSRDDVLLVSSVVTSLLVTLAQLYLLGNRNFEYEMLSNRHRRILGQRSRSTAARKGDYGFNRLRIIQEQLDFYREKLALTGILGGRFLVELKYKNLLAEYQALLKSLLDEEMNEISSTTNEYDLVLFFDSVRPVVFQALLQLTGDYMAAETGSDFISHRVYSRFGNEIDENIIFNSTFNKIVTDEAMKFIQLWRPQQIEQHSVKDITDAIADAEEDREMYKIYKALFRLPRIERIIIVLRYFLHFPRSRVASVLNTSENVVIAKEHLAIMRLTKVLKSEGFETDSEETVIKIIREYA